MIKDIAFVAYAVSDIAKSRKFYEGILGLKVGGEFDGSKNPYFVEYIVGNSALAIGQSPEWLPSEDGASVALETDDFDKTIAELKKHNVPFKLEPQDFPTCRMAVVQDPDKNKVCIHQKK
jgi:catechol 2,3-dioxygenase-like lactoylglutathione lyase family enzyme